MQRSRTFEGLIKIFEIASKKELRRCCSTIVIRSSDFGRLVMFAEAGLVNYSHRMYNHDIRDPQLEPNQVDFDVIRANGSGPIGDAAQRVLRKLAQLFRTRRYLVGHLFHSADLSTWQFFYFDQRDTDEHHSHWKEGSHIHLINHLWPGRTAMSMWADFLCERPKINGGLHIRYMNDIRARRTSQERPAGMNSRRRPTDREGV